MPLVSIATELSSSPPGEYAQEIPLRPSGGKQSGPPILPPHLLQVILNKDTPAHVSTPGRKQLLIEVTENT